MGQCLYEPKLKLNYSTKLIQSFGVLWLPFLHTECKANPFSGDFRGVSVATKVDCPETLNLAMAGLCGIQLSPLHLHPISSTQRIWPLCLAALNVKSFGYQNHSALPLSSLSACEQGSKDIPYGNMQVLLLWSPRDDVSLKPFYVSRIQPSSCLKPIQIAYAIPFHNKVALWI